MKKVIAFIQLAILFLLFFYAGAIAQDQPKKEEAAPAPPPAPVFPQKDYDIPYDILWDKIIEMLKEKGLYIHAHGKASEDKENGKITTQTFRYFSIIQAFKPVIELDYRDQYIITVIKPPEPKKEEPKAAEPVKDAKDAKVEASTANPAAAEKKEEAPAQKTDQPQTEKPAPQPEAPKVPPVIKVQIERKFEKHNGLPNPQGGWASADPKMENNIGISEDVLFNTLDLLVASLPKAASAPIPATTAPAAPASATSTAPGGK